MNLRFRFILSNVLPLFIVLPLIGLLSIYIFERRILIPRQSEEIEADLELLTHLILDEPEAFGSQTAGRRFAQRYSSGANWRLMILDPDGIVIATNYEEDISRIGTPIKRMEFNAVLTDGQIRSTAYSESMKSDAIDLWAPVHDSSGELLGVLRLTQPLDTLAEDVMRVRGFVIALLAAGLLVGALIGLGLAVSMEIPLEKMTHSLQEMAWENNPDPIEMSGPEEIRTLSSAFNHLIDRIKELENTRKKLLANLVHELGRPLGALRAAIHALDKGAFEDPILRNELLSGMDTQSRDLERLVDDLTHLYDESMGRFELKLENVKLDEWLKSSIAPWKAQAQSKALEIEIQVPDLPHSMIDPIRMSQAVGNLLSNAIKYTPNGGEIQVHAFIENQKLVIHVKDDGPGLSEEDLDNLFTPFYRGKQSTRFPKGMGLGLSIARDIVQSHNGSLIAESIPGDGSQFSIQLPLNLRLLMPNHSQTDDDFVFDQ
jgi:two-component system sensor histidine kinase BaeS